jgi:DNA polymerase V
MRCMHNVVALIDCNNFYCSCERVFNAALRQRPVIVLSNNDGCVVARSNEVKALGVKMGQPLFEIRDLIEQHNGALFSSNYPLYADMSARVMSTLASFAPRAEIYSIDESFLDVSHIRPECLDAYGHEIRETVWRLTGIPVSVGIASTKTLAKVANEVAKHNPCYQGVLNLTRYTEEELDELLASLAIKDVWGIGPRYAHRLQASRNICTAKDLKYADEYWIRKRFSVVVQRTVLELRGIACIPLETEPKPKQGIMTAKSFGRPVESLEEVIEAVATYTARAVEKLRSQESAASSLTVFLQTNPFKADAPQYAKSISRLLPYPSSFTPDFLTVAIDIVRSIYKPGMRYKKAGVFLSKIVSQEVLQVDLFGEYTLEREYTKTRLMAMVDFINQWWGQNTIFFGAQGIGRAWKMRQERRSPRYTTCWGEIVVVST